MGADSRSDAVAATWEAFVAARGVSETRYDVYEFGDSKKLQDSLAALVVAGVKRGTTSLVQCIEREGDAISAVGQYGVVVDGAGAPQCVIRVVRVDVMPLDQVDAAFAFDEGEGDRSLAYWRDAHIRYFERQERAAGAVFHPGLDVVCERFAVVWPPELADG